MKRLLALILVLIFALSSMVACSGGDADITGGTPAPTEPPEGNVTPDPNEGNVETPPETSENELIGLPEDIDFGEKTVSIFHWQEYNPEFNVEEDDLDGDPINDAIYKKNLYTEEKLNVKLDFFDTPGDGANMKAFNNVLKNRMGDPMNPVDIVAAYGRTTGLSATNGYLQDLSVLENLDLNKEWWPKFIQEKFDFDGRMYFITGDISTNLLFMMYGVYYNIDLLNDHGLENPIALVDSDMWTIDKLMDMSVGVYDDLDTISGPSENDYYGLVGAYWDIDPLYHGAGYSLVEKDDSGEKIIKWADEIRTDVVGSFVAKVHEWIKYDDIALETKSTHGSAFHNGRSLFSIQAASVGFALRETDIKYGVVPMPKLDPSVQKDYITCLANPYTLYGICTKSPNPEMAAATMQTLGYYAMEYTSPAVFEVTLKGKWSKEEDTIRMWDKMRAGISFDLGRIYHTQLSSPADFVSIAAADGTEWSTLVSGNAFARREGLMDRLNRDLEELING